MPGEIKHTQMERVADLESRLARFERREGRGNRPQQLHPQQVLMARTQGNDYQAANDESYPEQVDGKGMRLPIVFLDVEYDTATDEVNLVPRSLTPQAWVYSPFGWIPRMVEIQVHQQNGLWVVEHVPEQAVHIWDEYDIEADGSGIVRIDQFTENTQEMLVHFDFMAGSGVATFEQPAFAWLDRKRKYWRFTNKEC